MSTRIERRLTAKTICGMTADQIAKLGRANDTILYHIIGKAMGSRLVDTTYGPSMALMGQFEGVAADTGEIKYSGTYYPPKFVADMLSGASADHILDFALSIGVRPADNQMGYEYYCDTHQDPKADESMITLRKLIPEVKKKAIAG